ncbi:MAG: trypsin-like peptidase domain-containing protein [Elusimicrobia bacterium]|nr:trypsin-like peptidase domain-containing protein [Elusimicrobiota bacterium]
MGRAACLAAALAAAAGPWPRPAAAGEDDIIRKSVVKIFTTYQKPDYYQPWQLSPQDQLSGSGVIIEGGRILTNAHVVSDHIFIQVRKAGDADKFNARVEFVGHDTELATLKVDDPRFFAGTRPIEFGALPRQRDRVAAYGFPTGGDELSITEGVVSRIEVIEYTHSSRRLLAIQTDAAINPGNSGGPVVKDGRLVGISFQSFSGQGVENIGYAVPITLINRFLKDISTGRYDKIPYLGTVWEPMENPDLRRFYKLSPEQTGILVNRVTFGSSAWGVLKEGDVVTAIDGLPIANDGTYVFDKDKRLQCSNLTAMHQAGDIIPVDVIRDGKAMRLRVTLSSGFKDLVDGPFYDVKPSYYIFAGLVFTPVTRNYIGLWNPNNVPTSLKHLQEYIYPTAERQQAVVLAYVLPHDANTGYHDFRSIVVESINGIHISEMKDIVTAIQKPQGSFHVIRTDSVTDFGGKIILNAEQAEKAHKEILSQHGIPSDRSDDLK